MRIGIDFGSTYSTFSAYNAMEDRVDALILMEGESASIPSVVSISKKGKAVCGKAAKNDAARSKRNVRIFEAFKMLLNEPDQVLLKKRGYDEVYNPRKITRIYLESLLQGFLDRYNDKQFEEVYICVPEVWCKSFQTLDGRSILRDIIQNELSVPVNHVTVVTEPEAASSYFAYHYEKATGKPFNGYLLLIDYGGGTLDITLTEVSSDGRGFIETSCVESGGAGENHDGTLGSAGIAYMQKVVQLALIEKGLLEPGEDPDYTDPVFISAVLELESRLKSPEGMKDIEDYFGSYGSGYAELSQVLDDYDPFIDDLEYNDSEEEVPITYQCLLRAYKETIELTLNKQISDINRRVQRIIGLNPCEPAAGVRDNFKIALVGGFGSFYLVKKQLAEIYKLDANEKIDLRTKNIHAEKRELAISLGAALLAAEKVTQKHTADYSIGLYTAGADRRFHANYAIRHHQVVERGKPYYILRCPEDGDTPENRIMFGALYQNIRHFVIHFPEQGEGLMALKPAMLQRLEQIPQKGFWYCGFSVDESGIVRFHAMSAARSGKDKEKKEIVIPLDSFERLFEMTAL